MSSPDPNSTCLSDPHERKLFPTEMSDRTLGLWNIGRVFGVIGGTILALIPLFFMVVAILAMSLSQKPTTIQPGPDLEHILILLPTLFPIAFAATMGHLISIFIVLLWLLSPAGGQSAIRLLTKEPIIATTTSTVRYLPIEVQSHLFLNGADDAFTSWGLYVPLFTMSLLTQKTQSQPRDTLGNVKIPALDTAHPSVEGEGWQDVDYSQEVQYTSLLGIPTTGIPAKGDVTFTMASRYWDVTCSQNIWVSNKTALPIDLNPNDTGWGETGSYFHLDEHSHHTSGAWMEGKMPMYFMTGAMQAWNASFANCTLEHIVVEASTKCESGACRVTAMRPGNQSAGSPLIDPLPLWTTLLYLPETFMYPRSSDIWTTASPLELWLMDPTTDLTVVTSDSSLFYNISKLPTEVLASRLRVVINAFWQSGNAASYIEGNLPENLDNFTSLSATLGV
ncbi:uncharacterized protein BKCO1_3800021 [Diplodia corticola]|uniref:Uncharacterized protein n=1 Tax=Diplodia corticola TaxID=236234 RepID=A0A1J9RYC5_9PEZI|nr:uncharacterized protein BKCO1_3800021 [Diplodia corticola]OJD32453.1 hypothetical protein BKCO1_3800021 [Diplodia corticola]